MGLDSVEFVIALEQSFALPIPDADAIDLTTPRKVIRYLQKRLSSGESSACLDQMAFYSLRSAAMRILGRPRTDLTPQTRWDLVLASNDRRRQWQLVGQATGLPKWPRLHFWGAIPSDVATMGGTARYLAATCARAIKGNAARWTENEIAQVVNRLMESELGITKFDLDDRFVQDLGVD